MAAPLRFLLVGGFLGAGKTTLLAQLARHYTQKGHRVGLVTNDQAADLVDTRSLQAQGFPVEEVAGACFCCRFDELVGKVEQLAVDQRPDIILAEPVGSCTDLVATVVLPLTHLYGERFRVAPYAVLFKPSHGLRILRNEVGGGFSPKAAYIFRKQLEEADIILINRVDELPAAELAELTALVGRDHPGTPVLPISARTGQGLPALVELLDQERAFGRRVLDIDYDTYAEGEAELGWLNGTAVVRATVPFALDGFLLGVVDHLRQELVQHGGEIAHLKAIGLSDLSFGVANLVSSRSAAELSLPSNATVIEAEVVVNARVAASPETVQAAVLATLQVIATQMAATVEVRAVQSFRPGRPTPTHRYAASDVSAARALS